MSDQDRNFLLGKVSAGIEAERFIESSLGKYLIERAERERDAAFNEIKSMPWYRFLKFRELQNKIWRAESIQTWIAEVIQEGWNSEHALIEQETT